MSMGLQGLQGSGLLQVLLSILLEISTLQMLITIVFVKLIQLAMYLRMRKEALV